MFMSVADVAHAGASENDGHGCYVIPSPGAQRLHAKCESNRSTVHMLQRNYQFMSAR